MRTLLKDLFIRPDFDHAKAIVTFTPPAICDRARWQITLNGITKASGAVTIQSGKEACFECALPGFTAWHVNSPGLYTLELRLNIRGREVTETKRFGMRKFNINTEAVYVNNMPYQIRGYIRGREAHDHPNLLNLPLKDWYAKNIRMAKTYGFNFVRFHSQVPPEEFFEAADELGILVHVEMRKYFGRYQKERAMMDTDRLLDENEWTEMMYRLRNHASLMVYCMGNEIKHPGHNPRCKLFYDLTKRLDPTRLFLDTCAHGEFDRRSVDIDVQHMGYFFPFGKNYAMFEDTQNWLTSGSAENLPMIEQDRADDFNFRITRNVPSPRPVLAHEICHYAAWRDLHELERKFKAFCPRHKPWWIGELKKLARLKGHEKNYSQLLEASRRHQMLCWKLGIEAARRSRILSGFHLLQLSDTDRYENSNGVIDCFDDKNGVSEKEFLRFNADTVILADLPRRTFFEREEVVIPVMISHFSPDLSGLARFRFNLAPEQGSESSFKLEGGLDHIDLTEKGRRTICHLFLRLPESAKPRALTLDLRLEVKNGPHVKNSYHLWLYPNRPSKLPRLKATIRLPDEIQLGVRYPQIEPSGSLKQPEKLIIAHRFTGEILNHLQTGGDVLLLYRVPVTRDRKTRAKPEKYYLPATWDRFKGVIWDRGHNSGAIIRRSSALKRFPNNGFLDLQFYGLVNDSDKICLDDFPVPVIPVIEGIDKAVRDRFDVFTFKLSELQPAYTMRKFACLFEIRVGKGRLLVSGFNFTGLTTSVPETCAMFESLIGYVLSPDFKPRQSISAAALTDYLLKKGKEPILKERRMTQYWQLDEEPVESDRYWKESLAYLGEPPAVSDKLWMNEDKRKTETITGRNSSSDSQNRQNRTRRKS